MFRALLCSSSGGQNCITQHLVSSHSVGGRPVHRLREDSLNLCTERPVHVSSTVVFIIRRSKLYYTASGIVTLGRWPAGAQVGRGLSQPVHRTASTCFEHYGLIIKRSKLYYTVSGIVKICRWPSGAQVAHRTATYRVTS